MQLAAAYMPSKPEHLTLVFCALYVGLTLVHYINKLVSHIHPGLLSAVATALVALYCNLVPPQLLQKVQPLF